MNEINKYIKIEYRIFQNLICKNGDCCHEIEQCMLGTNNKFILDS